MTIFPKSFTLYISRVEMPWVVFWKFMIDLYFTIVIAVWHAMLYYTGTCYNKTLTSCNINTSWNINTHSDD